MNACITNVALINNGDQYSQLNLNLVPGGGSPKPFLALHPLSSTVSETKSHFTGIGLATPNEYDDFWLFTKSEFVNLVHIYSVNLYKTTSTGSN